MTVRSFSEIAWVYALSSDLLYPSDMKKIKSVRDRGSIQRSLPGNIESLFSGELKLNQGKNLLFRASKNLTGIVRVIARQITFFAIGVFAAPVGTVYHGFFATAYLFSKRRDASRKHFYSLSTDALFATVAIFAIYAFRNPYVSKYKLEKSFPYPRMIKSKELGAQVVALVFEMYISGYAGLDPKKSVQILRYKGERAGLYKSIILKKEFGILSKNGFLLSYKNSEDGEGVLRYSNVQLKGTFYEICQAKGMEMLNKLKDLTEKFPLLQINYPPRAKNLHAIVHNLKLARSKNEKAFIDNWWDEFQILELNYSKIYRNLTQCMNLDINDFMSSNNCYVVGSQFIFDRKLVVNYLRGSNRVMPESFIQCPIPGFFLLD